MTDNLNRLKYILEKQSTIIIDELNKLYERFLLRQWKVEPSWEEITKTLGNVKGIVSTEDRQLLKIVHNLSDAVVDEMISEYQKQYKQYLKDSKIYGKELWKSR